VVQAYGAGQWEGLAEAAESGPACPPRRLTVLAPALRRSVLAIVHSGPRRCGWCRTRWRCATSARELQARRGVVVSGETRRRGLQELGWVWKRAQLRAKDDDPQRVEKLARRRDAWEQRRAGVALFFADALDISLLAKVGSQGMPTGEQVEVLTPGTNEKRHVAGALNLTTGLMTPCVWYRKPTGLFLDLLQTLDRTYPARTFCHLQGGWTRPRFTRRPRWRSGSLPIPASSCSTCRPTVRRPIPLNGPAAMSMTNAPATIPASASGLWSRMSNGICRSMGRGATPSRKSTTRRR
jgi:hypothetical protein